MPQLVFVERRTDKNQACDQREPHADSGIELAIEAQDRR